MLRWLQFPAKVPLDLEDATLLWPRLCLFPILLALALVKRTRTEVALGIPPAEPISFLLQARIFFLGRLLFLGHRLMLRMCVDFSFFSGS